MLEFGRYAIASGHHPISHVKRGYLPSVTKGEHSIALGWFGAYVYFMARPEPRAGLLLTLQDYKNAALAHSHVTIAAASQTHVAGEVRVVALVNKSWWAMITNRRKRVKRELLAMLAPGLAVSHRVEVHCNWSLMK